MAMELEKSLKVSLLPVLKPRWLPSHEQKHHWPGEDVNGKKEGMADILRKEVI